MLPKSTAPLITHGHHILRRGGEENIFMCAWVKNASRGGDVFGCHSLGEGGRRNILKNGIKMKSVWYHFLLKFCNGKWHNFSIAKNEKKDLNSVKSATFLSKKRGYRKEHELFSCFGYPFFFYRGGDSFYLRGGAKFVVNVYSFIRSKIY